MFNSIKKVFGKSECDICLKECKVVSLDELHVCSDCYKKITELEKNGSFKIPKEQQAGGLKDEL